MVKLYLKDDGIAFAKLLDNRGDLRKIEKRTKGGTGWIMAEKANLIEKSSAQNGQPKSKGDTAVALPNIINSWGTA